MLRSPPRPRIRKNKMDIEVDYSGNTYGEPISANDIGINEGTVFMGIAEDYCEDQNTFLVVADCDGENHFVSFENNRMYPGDVMLNNWKIITDVKVVVTM